MLAAHDIQTALKEQFPKVWVSCYTLGSPRVGNRAFADTFNNSGDRRASMPLQILLFKQRQQAYGSMLGQQALSLRSLHSIPTRI